MIQQYLGWSHRGQFLNGTTLFKPDLGMEMRQRILQRAFGNASSKSHPLPFQTEAALVRQLHCSITQISTDTQTHLVRERTPGEQLGR